MTSRGSLLQQQQAASRGATQGLYLPQQSSAHPSLQVQPPTYMHGQPDLYDGQFMFDPRRPQTSALAQYGRAPDIATANDGTLGQRGADAFGSVPLGRRYFSKAITNNTSELPLSVIKELKSGFKNYIPLALCTHKSCSMPLVIPTHSTQKLGGRRRGR